jgi:hypothetical protein
VKRSRQDLASVLDDSQPHRAARGDEPPYRLVQMEKRIHTRFDKAFLVVIGSELYGDCHAIARNISTGGILVEMSYAPPLGTVVTIHFQLARPDDLLDEIVVRAEVKHHHYLNFGAIGESATSTRAIGLRFLEFVDAGERVAPERLH